MSDWNDACCAAKRRGRRFRQLANPFNHSLYVTTNEASLGEKLLGNWLGHFQASKFDYVSCVGIVMEKFFPSTFFRE